MTPASSMDSAPSPTSVSPGTTKPGDCAAMRQVLERVGDRWSLIIVTTLSAGERRFNELRRDLVGISQRMLTRTLRNLERDGLVKRAVGEGRSPTVSYSLSPLGWSLFGAARHLLDWAIRHGVELDDARVTYDSAGDFARRGQQLDELASKR